MNNHSFVYMFVYIFLMIPFAVVFETLRLHFFPPCVFFSFGDVSISELKIVCTSNNYSYYMVGRLRIEVACSSIANGRKR